MLITVRPGPVLHVWDDKGREVAAVPLTRDAALHMMTRLLKEVCATPTAPCSTAPVDHDDRH